MTRLTVFWDSDIIMKTPLYMILTKPSTAFPKGKKRYGNMTGEEYLEWFSGLAPLFSEILAEDGSVVIEIGNAWEKGVPLRPAL